MDTPALAEWKAGRAKPVHAKVLIAEDDHVIADVLCLILHIQGYRARAVYSAEQAMTACEDFQPDLIVLEAWFWQGMHGIDLAIWLRQHHPECRLFVWSAWQSIIPPLIQKAAEQGYDFNVRAKPIQVPNLLGIFADLIIPGEAIRV
jgi:DNA-binding NtrC family response regulator